MAPRIRRPRLGRSYEVTKAEAPRYPYAADRFKWWKSAFHFQNRDSIKEQKGSAFLGEKKSQLEKCQGRSDTHPPPRSGESGNPARRRRYRMDNVLRQSLSQCSEAIFPSLVRRFTETNAGDRMILVEGQCGVQGAFPPGHKFARFVISRYKASYSGGPRFSFRTSS
jgi:hypothetical protein